MYSLIVFLPLIGAVLASGFGRYIGGRGAGYLTISCLFLT
jgi:NADH:ubiquinone oxidoreductase subunit 5 (subunit L)/multisubunit Na+/H+ antiporter MnhA subunit